jgi:hypothetical protein
VAVSAHVLTRELEELIAALDLRYRASNRRASPAFARDAAALRAKAVDRLAELADKSPVPAGASTACHSRGTG